MLFSEVKILETNRRKVIVFIECKSFKFIKEVLCNKYASYKTQLTIRRKTYLLEVSKNIIYNKIH